MNDLYIRRIFLDGPLSESGYLEKLPLVKNLLRQGGIDFTQRVTFFVGENGTGKSTLLEALAVVWGFNPEGGSRNFAFSTADSHSALCKNLRIWARAGASEGRVLSAGREFLQCRELHR